jgi:hypothetical protein
MKRSWKTPKQVPVLYSNSFSNNLLGTFEVERLDDSVCLTLDLSCNLRVRNREQNDYQDACDMVESHLDLKSIQVPDDVMEYFAAAYKQVPEATKKLRIILGEQAYDYSVVRAESSNGGNVSLIVMAATPPVPGSE